MVPREDEGTRGNHPIMIHGTAGRGGHPGKPSNHDSRYRGKSTFNARSPFIRYLSINTICVPQQSVSETPYKNRCTEYFTGPASEYHTGWDSAVPWPRCTEAARPWENDALLNVRHMESQGDDGIPCGRSLQGSQVPKAPPFMPHGLLAEVPCEGAELPTGQWGFWGFFVFGGGGFSTSLSPSSWQATVRLLSPPPARCGSAAAAECLILERPRRIIVAALPLFGSLSPSRIPGKNQCGVQCQENV